MAVIKAVNSKSSLNGIIKYITQKEKTEEMLISGKDCNPITAYEEMQTTKELFKKTTGRQYKHFVQSFNPSDNLDYEKAHNIGLQWAEKNFKGYEVLISTHKDKEHIHNHFVVNSVSFQDGSKFRYSKKELEQYKALSDKICEREGLSIIKEHSRDITSFSQKKYKVLEKAFKGEVKSYVLNTGLEVSKSIKNSKTKEEFIKDMEQKGYEVNWKDTRKYITFTTPEGKKVRNSNLYKTLKKEKFTKEGMENEFRYNRERAGKSIIETTKGNTRGTELPGRASNVNWSSTRDNVQSEGNRVSKQFSNDVVGEIQQKVRGVKERTNRAVGESKPKDTENRGQQQTIQRSSESRSAESKQEFEQIIKRTKSKNYSRGFDFER